MIARSKLSSLAPDLAPDSFLKVVVDIERRILSFGCELHIDCAEELLKDGSLSENLWGANVYLDKKQVDFVSFINIRPGKGNKSMEIAIPEIREIVGVVIREILF